MDLCQVSEAEALCNIYIISLFCLQHVIVLAVLSDEYVHI